MAQLIRGTVVTMDPDRRIIGDGAVLIEADRIVDVGPAATLLAAHPEADVHGTPTDLVVPGYVNGHQHLTGDRLIQSAIPDDLPPGESIFSWVVPVHAAHTPADDELAATLTLAESLTNGVTTTFEAGTVAHPDRVAAAATRLGARLVVGTWGWDIDDAPYAAPADEVLDRQRAVLERFTGPLVTAWVTLVGHDLMSDQLVSGASTLARERGVGVTFHLSPTTSDPESYLARTGRWPVVHLADLGVLGPHVAIGHGVHLDDEEVAIIIGTETAVVSCPWAYLRLGQGVTGKLRHLDLWRRGGRLALGCDAENAGDVVDGLRTAALFAGLAKDVSTDPTVFGAHDAFELLTIKGAGALGCADRIGSIEPGKQADLVIHDRSTPAWQPLSADPVLQLVWGSDGRSVRDVFVAGEMVVRDGEIARVDMHEVAGQATEAAAALVERAGIAPASRWPTTSVAAMTYPNTLIFIDFPSDDPEASATFYSEVFGWEVEPRPAGVFHRVVPGQNFLLDDGTQGPTGNLHMGIHNVANARPHPDPDGADPRELSRDGRTVRVWILVSDDDSSDAIMDRAIERGATELWRNHFWAEFNGFNAAFRDPWGNTLVLWTKGGDDPQIPDGWTNE